MDNVLVDFASAFPLIDAATKERYADNLKNIPGIFALMQPMAGAVEAFRGLAEIYDVYILSTAPWNNPSAWSDKLEWVKRHLGEMAYKRLILTHHKNLNRGDFLVDDWDKHGADQFEGEWIQFGSEPFKDWASVLKYLL
jgi:5'(3')-deoxyribonucleotidase